MATSAGLEVGDFGAHLEAVVTSIWRSAHRQEGILTAYSCTNRTKYTFAPPEGAVGARRPLLTFSLSRPGVSVEIRRFEDAVILDIAALRKGIFWKLSRRTGLAYTEGDTTRAVRLSRLA